MWKAMRTVSIETVIEIYKKLRNLLDVAVVAYIFLGGEGKTNEMPKSAFYAEGLGLLKCLY